MKRSACKWFMAMNDVFSVGFVLILAFSCSFLIVNGWIVKKCKNHLLILNTKILNFTFIDKLLI